MPEGSDFARYALAQYEKSSRQHNRVWRSIREESSPTTDFPGVPSGQCACKRSAHELEAAYWDRKPAGHAHREAGWIRIDWAAIGGRWLLKAARRALLETGAILSNGDMQATLADLQHVPAVQLHLWTLLMCKLAAKTARY